MASGVCLLLGVLFFAIKTTAMNLVELEASSIPIGKPLPFPLRGVGGVLLAREGTIIETAQELRRLQIRGQALYVDVSESDEIYRAYLAQLQSMLYSGSSTIKDISRVTLQSANTKVGEAQQKHPDWGHWQVHWTRLLRQPEQHTFLTKLERMFTELYLYSEKNPDAALLALIQLSAEEVRYYSATHAMLTALICTLVARETLNWPKVHIQSLGRAALTMNIAMTQLQDDLAQQLSPLTAEQARSIDRHSESSLSQLQLLGVSDPFWLEAVKYHHFRDPGRLAEKSPGRRMARLIQRADIFGARIAPRVGRSPMSVTSAMQACYYDETKAVDEAGTALVKTLGIYPPGAWVRLASQEAGIVLRRSDHAATPTVAVLLNREGMPCEPIPRDTAQATYKIAGTVSHKDVRVRVALDKLLAL